MYPHRSRPQATLRLHRKYLWLLWFITCHGSAIVRALHAAMQQEQVGGENGANEEEEQDDDDGMDQDRLAK